MKYQVSGVGELELDTIILDLNGTLAVHGELVDGVAQRIARLKEMGFKIYLFSGDQRGNAKQMCAVLGIELMIAKLGSEKTELMKQFDKDKTVAIGNARIDIGTFQNAALKIATLQAEGIHASILNEIDVLMPGINEALDILIDPDIMGATMRT